MTRVRWKKLREERRRKSTELTQQRARHTLGGIISCLKWSASALIFFDLRSTSCSSQGRSSCSENNFTHQLRIGMFCLRYISIFLCFLSRLRHFHLLIEHALNWSESEGNWNRSKISVGKQMTSTREENFPFQYLLILFVISHRIKIIKFLEPK